MDPRAQLCEIGAEGRKVIKVAVGLLDDLKDVGKRAAKLAAELTGRFITLAQRGEIPQDVREAQLALGVVDVEVDGVAVGDDRAGRLFAQQRDRSVTVASRGDLKQRGLLAHRHRHRHRQPDSPARGQSSRPRRGPRHRRAPQGC